MFDVTPESANFWFDAFNVLLFIGAFAVAVGTYGSIKMGSAKERFADERILANEKETRRAIADSDIAKEGTARANERIAELNNETAKLRQQLEPRKLDGETFVRLLRDGPKAKVELLYVKEDPDSYQLSLQIFWYLMHAGWDCEVEKPIPPAAINSPYQDKPATWSVVARETGISLVVHEDNDLKPGTPYDALLKAFHATPGRAETGIDSRVPAGTIRVVVAPRPLPSVWAPDDIFSDTGGKTLVRP
ncbi:hypothetical protein ACQR13_21125 [Bradyrhizobium sp. HKCCYLRH3059]|uniref:hypothetical protein n=1 Tax=Bradyrhizobium sp. HKCCYLRH3059 TaxID=3420745 RepID=UPI003EBB13E0